MKLFHWKISKSTLLLGFNIFLVITAAFLLLINIQSRKELEDSKRGFYSERASYLINEDSGWDAIQDILRGDSWNDGILYKKDLEMNADTRGVFYKGDFRKLPLIEGRYFTEEEVSSGSRKVMLGHRDLKKRSTKKKGSVTLTYWGSSLKSSEYSVALSRHEWTV